MNESLKQLKARQAVTAKGKRAPAAGTADTLSSARNANESPTSMASLVERLKQKDADEEQKRSEQAEERRKALNLQSSPPKEIFEGMKRLADSMNQPEAKPFAYVADPNHPMPRTYPEWAESRRSGYVENSPIEMGERLAKKSVYAIIQRELEAAISECSEQDLLILVESVRLCRDLHGSDACQNGYLIGAILQTLGFGAGHVSRSQDGELEVHSAPGFGGEVA